MARNAALGFLCITSLSLQSTTGFAFGVSHHGGIILDCTAPVFFDEFPPKEAKVASFDRFSFTASENTDAETLKVWINAQPVEFTVTPQASGRLTVAGKLQQPIVQGKAWIKVTGISHDGCDQLHNWNVHLGQ